VPFARTGRGPVVIRSISAKPRRPALTRAAAIGGPPWLKSQGRIKNYETIEARARPSSLILFSLDEYHCAMLRPQKLRPFERVLLCCFGLLLFGAGLIGALFAFEAANWRFAAPVLLLSDWRASTSLPPSAESRL
jgi:hypothetical protein